ncbi:sterol desaturase family protein [Neolewinella sp.]|uniref:sterol desaturase family protein n=1 Tax=Neolewinella sp. TaxID=2993543 RepID=UPI003B52D527
MTKPLYTFDDIQNLEFPPVIVYAVPVMVALTIVEWFLRRREYIHELEEAAQALGFLTDYAPTFANSGYNPIRYTQRRNAYAEEMKAYIADHAGQSRAEKHNYDIKDGLAAAGVGVGNLISTALVKAATFGIILFFYNLTPLYIPTTWWSFVLCFVVVDFCRYWAHRVSHEQRFWWATHVTHHSSEQYNFTVSFRLSWTQHIKVIFFIPAALLGFDPFVFFICMQIGVLYQFWIHTELIDRMWAPIEFVFVTPSHHRVHHATEEKYLDKNYGSSLIIWDRLFGTFCPEQETPNYGILKPVNSYNPIKLVFHEHVDMFRDMNTYRHPRAWWRIWFGGPGLTLDKEKHYGFYKYKDGIVPSASESQKEKKVGQETPGNVVV